MDANTQIFTTGAFLQPTQINGTYYWIVIDFEDDSFLDGKYINPRICTEKVENLIIQEEEE